MALVKIGKAAEMLGVEVRTLRRWEDSGELVPDRRSAGGTRYYDVAKILGLGNEDMPRSATPASPATIRRMIWSASRNCSKPSVLLKAGGTKSSPISAPA